MFLFTLYPLTSPVIEPSGTNRHSQQRMCVLIQQLKGHFQFTKHWNSLPYNFYSTNSINLTLPSGSHHSLSLSVNPVRFILIPSFLVRLWCDHYLSAHVHLWAWLCSKKKIPVWSWVCSKKCKITSVKICRMVSVPVVHFNNPVHTVKDSFGSCDAFYKQNNPSLLKKR